ncbi:MAG: hypothetical protein ABIH23_19575, partial [bacterium]
MKIPVFLFIVLFTVCSLTALSADEFLVLSSTPSEEAAGLCFVEPDRETVIVIPDEAGSMAKYAASLLQTNIERSTQHQAKLLTQEESHSGGFLAHAIQLVVVGRSLQQTPLRDTFTIQASRDWGRNIIRVSSPSERGLIRGAAELLRRTVGAEWFPPRTHHCYFGRYNGVSQQGRMKLTTYLERRKRLVWPDTLNPFTHTDLFQDQGLLIDRFQVHPSLIDWSLLQGIDLLAVFLQTSPQKGNLFIPVEGDEIVRLRKVFDHAHEL